MSDAPDPEQQQQEVVSAGADPTERAISKLLYEAELETQKRDGVQQVLDKAKAEHVTVPNKAFYSDPMHGKPGPDRFPVSHHAQYGSHGLSGIPPK